MKHVNVRNILIGASLIGATALGTGAMADAQEREYAMGPGRMGGFGAGMMGENGGMMGGYGPGQGGGYEEHPQAGYPDLNSHAGRLFAQTCSQCHALPDPRQHSAEQWPGVVARMEQHMREQKLPLPGNIAIDEVEAFLGRHTTGSR